MDIFCRLRTWYIFLVTAFSLGVRKTHSAGTTGQKAHFQVEDKSGDLKITATKDLAKVTAQADSVQVVVKPGMADYPVVKSDKPIVHVVNGWNTMAFRKSSIPGISKKIKHPCRQGNQKPRIKSNSKKRNSKFNPNSQKLNGRKKSTSHHHHLLLHQRRKGEVQGSKKSDFETGFRVTGTAGKLKMDVTKAETEVLSESGTVDVFLKQKPKQRNDDVSGRNADEILHSAPKWHVISDTGLRKSDVPVKRRPLNFFT